MRLPYGALVDLFSIWHTFFLSQLDINICIEWDNLTRLYEKHANIITTDGVPAFFIKILVQLEDTIKNKASNKELKKKMAPTKAKALNSIKQKTKKWLNAYPDIVAKMESYRLDPSSINDEEQEEAPTEKTHTTKKASDKGKVTGRAKWLKQADYESSSSDEEDDDYFDDFDDYERKMSNKKKDANKKQPKPSKRSEQTDDTKKVEEPKERQEEWTVEKIEQKSNDLLDRRGTKNYDRLKQVRQFISLIEKAKEINASVDVTLRLTFNLINAQFDASPNMVTHMTTPMWKSCYNNIIKVLNILSNNDGAFELVDSEPDTSAKIPQVRSPLIPQIERLHEEYLNSLKAMDEYTQEYVSRLRHETPLLKLTRAVFDYYQSQGQQVKAAILASRRLDHLYYKREYEHMKTTEVKTKTEETRDIKEAKPDSPIKDDDSLLTDVQDEELDTPNVPDDKNLEVLVPELCHLIYRVPDELFPDTRLGKLLQAKAVLQHIYHLALYDRYYEARDMMLMSRLHESVSSSADSTLKILYNRALVQLGLSAFRNGLFTEAQVHLADFMSSNKHKEWLAQGIYRSSEKTAEEERNERLRQVPCPMFINLELLELAHLVSSMLYDVTNIFLNEHTKNKVGSKGFKKLLDIADKTNFSGPPETIKEHIVAATNALKESDWERCLKYLLDLDVWKFIYNADELKRVLEQRVKEECLRAFILVNANHYDSISLDTLVSMFSLSSKRIHSIISKMIVNEEFHASWDLSLKCYIVKNSDANNVTWWKQLNYLKKRASYAVA